MQFAAWARVANRLPPSSESDYGTTKNCPHTASEGGVWYCKWCSLINGMGRRACPYVLPSTTERILKENSVVAVGLWVCVEAK